ncbi:MAG: lmo0937 family membrane protein [Desulfobacteraceae bacterium]|nr:MAG: lmo0937 family membrane protein [Desulfobacteraceae bacterium]
MLYTIAVILLILWLLGFVNNYTMGGFIHILLAFAVATILVKTVQGRKIKKSAGHHKPN